MNERISVGAFGGCRARAEGHLSAGND